MSSTRKIAIGVAAAAVTGGVALGLYGLPAANHQAGATSFDPGSRPQWGAVAAAGTITRAQVIARARTWHPNAANRVPYSQSRTYGGYRTDCSGYASMALALGKPGLNTVGLARPSVTTRIPMSSLRQGDLIIDATGTNNTRHVVIFDHWTSSRHTAYYEYEQRGGYGTSYRTRTYGLASGSQYHAYRPKKIR